jgi:hypothetical protein
MREIPGAPGYFADEAGRIFSGRRPGVLRELRLCANIHGYLHFEIVLNGRRHTTRVHKAVALAYLGERPPGAHIRHLDGDQRNNAPSNLAYGTASENCADRERHGRGVVGEKNPSAKLSNKDAEDIRRRRAAGERGADLAREYGVSQGTIWFIKAGRHFKNHTSKGDSRA